MRVILDSVRLYEVWTRGEIVLPKALRDQLEIRPGDDVDIVERDEVVIRKLPSKADTTAERAAR